MGRRAWVLLVRLAAAAVPHLTAPRCRFVVPAGCPRSCWSSPPCLMFWPNYGPATTGTWRHGPHRGWNVPCKFFGEGLLDRIIYILYQWCHRSYLQ